MGKVWVVNSTSGPRTYGGELLALGEGAWVDDGISTTVTDEPELTADERRFLRAFMQLGGRS